MQTSIISSETDTRIQESKEQQNLESSAWKTVLYICVSESVEEVSMNFSGCILVNSSIKRKQA